MKHHDRSWIAVAIIIGFIAAGGVLFYRGIPPNNEQLLTYMLGQLSGLATAIVSFHFGSSRGSEEKSAAIRAIAENAGSTTEETTHDA